VSTLKVQLLVVIESVSGAGRVIPVVVAHVIGDWRRLTEPARRRRMSVLINEHNHPYANGTGRAEQRRAMDPAWPALLVCVFDSRDGTGQPANLGSHAACSVGKGVTDRSTDTVVAADAFEERRLHDSGNAKRWRGE
jgi:hypothetical protein